jgi:protein-disulfide isomerase
VPQAKKRKGEQPAASKPQRNDRMQKITMYTGAAVLTVVLVLVGLYLFQSRAPVGEEGSSHVDFQLDQQPSLGEPDAPVKVIEFGDYKCPACKAFHDRVFYQLKEDYIDTGKVEFFFLDFPLPLGQDSYTAAVAGECVYRQSEAAFWAYFSAVYQNQGDERETWATPSNLMGLVRDYVEPLVDIDEADLQQCISEDRYRAAVDEDKRIGLKAGVRGTPSIFVNGKKVERWSPYSSFKAVIDRQLEQTTAP